MWRRVEQFIEAGARPSADDYRLGQEWLTPALDELFRSQHPRDIVHAAATARWLIERGHTDADLVAAALLHDCAKGDQRRFDRAAYVVAGGLGLDARAADPRSRFAWRRALARSKAHSEASADAAGVAGASERAVELVRNHHAPAGADAMLALLQEADAAS